MITVSFYSGILLFFIPPAFSAVSLFDIAVCRLLVRHTTIMMTTITVTAIQPAIIAARFATLTPTTMICWLLVSMLVVGVGDVVVEDF